jgi:hypothetical protein
VNRYIDPRQAAEHERRVEIEDARALRADRLLDIAWYVVGAGFLLCGLVGLLSGESVWGIG